MSFKVLLPAGLLLLGGCSWFEQGPRELTAELASQPPKHGFRLGGSVDSLEVEPGKGLLTVRGWHMLTPETARPELEIYASGAEAILSLERIDRPDVAAELDNPDLMNSGFEIQIKLTPGTEVTNFCMTFDDKHYGPRLLNPHSPDQVRCTLRD